MAFSCTWALGSKNKLFCLPILLVFPNAAPNFLSFAKKEKTWMQCSLFLFNRWLLSQKVRTFLKVLRSNRRRAVSLELRAIFWFKEGRKEGRKGTDLRDLTVLHFQLAQLPPFTQHMQIDERSRRLLISSAQLNSSMFCRVD